MRNPLSLFFRNERNAIFLLREAKKKKKKIKRSQRRHRRDRNVAVCERARSSEFFAHVRIISRGGRAMMMTLSLGSGRPMYKRDKERERDTHTQSGREREREDWAVVDRRGSLKAATRRLSDNTRNFGACACTLLLSHHERCSPQQQEQ